MRKILYSIFTKICIIALLASSTAVMAQPPATITFIDEDFNSCPTGPPAGWTDSIVEGPYNWVYNKNGFGGGSLNGTCAAVFDDDAGAAINPPNHAWVESPKVDITGYNFPTLEFDYNFNNVGGQEKFVVSVWDGDSWEVVLEVEDPVTGGNNGQVNASIDVSQYANPNFQARWEWIDDGEFSWGAGFDNVLLTADEIVQYNARVTRNYPAIPEYTLVPLSQTPFNVEAIGWNIGTDPLTGVVITTTISNTAAGIVQTRVSDPRTLLPGDTFHFQWDQEGFTPPVIGVWTITHDITVNEPDQDLSDNSVPNFDQEFSEFIYARDDDNLTAQLGINGGEGQFANLYDVNYESVVKSVSATIGNNSTGELPNPGQQYRLELWSCENGIPDEVVAASPNLSVAGATQFLAEFEFENGGFVATPDTYAAVVVQADATFLPVATADNIWTAGKSLVEFNGSGGWTPIETFGFQVVYGIRLNFACLRLNPGADTAICSDEQITLGGNPTAAYGSGDGITYDWQPSADLDDPTSANPVFSPSDTGEYVFTVTATDTARGCSEEGTVTVMVTDRPAAGLAGLKTDYCIYDDPDTLDVQPIGGDFFGPGLVIADSGSAGGGASGYIETITAGGNGGNVGGMVYFTVNNISGAPINLTEVGMNMSAASDVLIYLTPGGHAGNETNPGAWTQVGTADGSNGPFSGPFPGNGTLTACPVQGTVTIPTGVWGVAFETPSASHNYTNGNGANEFFSNADLELDLGSASNTPFSAPFTPRVWNGFLEYELAGGPGSGPVVLFDPDSAGVGEHTIYYCVTDDFGCTGCDSFHVRVHPRPDVTITDPGAICLNETIFLEAATPFGTWSGNGIVDPASGEFDASVAGIGNHWVYYELVDPNGCYNIDSINIEVLDIPVADAGMDLTVCRGESVQIGGNPTGSPGSSNNGFLDNYSWSPAAGLNSSVDPNPMASPDMTTTYTVTVTDNNGCTDTDEAVVEVRETPIADAGPDVVSCDGDPVLIGGSPSASAGVAPYTYSWTPATGLSDPTVASPTADPNVNTTYTLTVTDANGCQDEDEVVVSVQQSPTADAGNDITVCSDEEVTLGGAPTSAGGNPPYTYSWSPSQGLDNNTVANPTFSFNNTNANPITKQYTVTVMGESGCSSTDVVNVTVRPAVFADAGADTAICWGKSVELGGVAPATNGIPPYSYEWGPTVGLITPNVPNPTVTPTSSTIYTLTVTDGVGCVGDDEVEVIVNPLPKVDAGPDQSICEGNTVKIGGQPTANDGKAPYTYTWSPSIGLNDETLPNPLAGPNAETSFTITVTDNNGCVNNDVMTVFVNPNPVAHAGVDKQICIGESIEIGANPAASNGTGPYHYEWTPKGSLDDEQLETPNASPSQTTKYTLTVSDQNNCKDTDEMLLTVNELPNPEIVDLEIDHCYDDSIKMLQGDPKGGVFIGDGVFGSTFIPSAAGVGAHSIKYIYTDENGCTDSTFEIIHVRPLPFIDAGPDKFIYLSQNTTLDATSDGNYIYVWDPTTSLDDPNALNPEVIGLTETTTFTVSAENQWGCTRSDEVTVVVDVNLPIDPPNLFTPNGDGINDTWIIEELAFFPDNNLKIFNRYGQIVFEMDNVGTTAWTGDDLPEGTYYWVLTLNNQGNTTHRGTITIKR